LQLVAINTRAASPLRMPLTKSPKQAEQALIGQVLKNLRERADKTQGEVGRALGLTAAGYQYYEAGSRKFTAEKIAAALAAVGAGEYDFEAEKARVLGSPQAQAQGFAEDHTPFIYDVYGRTRSGDHGPEVYDVSQPQRRLDLRQLLGPTVDALEVAGDRVSPWAESGEIVLFDRARPPRRGKGCVVEMKSGEAHVLMYDKSDGSTYFLRELFPQDRGVTLPAAEIRGVYPVILRGD
jgi:transcriptional regulator with XRE-family HTH domain